MQRWPGLLRVVDHRYREAIDAPAPSFGPAVLRRVVDAVDADPTRDLTLSGIRPHRTLCRHLPGPVRRTALSHPPPNGLNVSFRVVGVRHAELTIPERPHDFGVTVTSDSLTRTHEIGGRAAPRWRITTECGDDHGWQVETLSEGRLLVARGAAPEDP